MGREVYKRNKKQKKRQAKRASSLEWDRVRKLKSDFPEIVFEENHSCKQIVDEVRQIIKDLTASPAILLRERKLLKLVKEGNPLPSEYRGILSLKLGEAIYGQLQNSFQLSSRISLDIEVLVAVPRKDQILIRFHSLVAVANSLYCSPRKFRVDFLGEERIVAFSLHALENIGNRTVYDPDAYRCRGQTFAFPYRYRYFERAQLANGTEAVAIWNWCDPDTTLGKVHLEMLGDRAEVKPFRNARYIFIDNQIACYLVGYAPLTYDPSLEDYVIIKTVLTPGMDCTPEHANFLKRERPATVDRANFSKQAGQQNYRQLEESRDYRFLRELHHYIPQIKVIREELFDYSVGYFD